MASKEDWIDAALDHLLVHGSPNVKVERLARAMGVTKGSFYWHFQDRDDLLRQTAEQWFENQQEHLRRLRQGQAAPGRRLEELIAFTAAKDGRPDLAMRLWARQAPWVDDLVKQVDRDRLAYCISLFEDLGFTGDAARLRANLVYYYQVADQTLSHRDGAETRSRLDALRLELLAGTPTP